MILDRATTTPNDGFRLFTCADTIGQSQFNAWGSWSRIPECSVSVFGDAPGVSDHAKAFGFRSIPTVKRDEFGRPLLNWIFERMHDEPTEGVLGYINSDIILLPGLASSIAAVRAQFDGYLIVARRWNIESLPPIDFGSGWDEKLRNLVTIQGELFSPYGIDLFVFNRGLLREIPPFALGSDYWDNYLVMRTRRRGYPVIDVTQQVMLVHQNHSLGKYRSVDARRRSPEGLRAFALAGDSFAMLGRATDATHVVADGQLTRAQTASVTVVLPYCGDARRLCCCLRLLEHQTYPQSYLNAIVVNNDPYATLRYLEADFPTIRVVNEANSLPAAARNKGISCAAADMVALFDADIVPTAHCLERAMRAIKDQPESQVLVCRIDPLFASGKRSYMARAVEWFDAATHYNPKDWITPAGAFVTGALVVRREVFAKYGYFSEVCPEAPSDQWEWARRVMAAGVKLVFCRDAVVRRETVRSISELRRKQQRHARGDCILKSLERSECYSAPDVFREDWSRFLGCLVVLWKNKRIPSKYRAGVLLVSICSLWWTLRAKLQYRTRAQRIVRRRRQAEDRPVQPNANAGTRRAGVPFRWLAARLAIRRSSTEDPMRRCSPKLKEL